MALIMHLNVDVVYKYEHLLFSSGCMARLTAEICDTRVVRLNLISHTRRIAAIPVRDDFTGNSGFMYASHCLKHATI